MHMIRDELDKNGEGVPGEAVQTYHSGESNYNAQADTGTGPGRRAHLLGCCAAGVSTAGMGACGACRSPVEACVAAGAWPQSIAS